MPRHGRLADDACSLGTDPRTDPRVVEALRPFGLHQQQPPITTTTQSPRAEQLEYIRSAEASFQAVFSAWVDGVSAVDGVQNRTQTLTGLDSNELPLYIHRPAANHGPLPCVIHLHGGGMTLLTAAEPVFAHLRDELAATGLVVIGVEFRNAGGQLGDNPYPAGLNDCVAAVRWAAAHLDEIGASHIVVAGESGGGNLTLATAIRAKREGWVHEISGVYAQCPYISDAYDAKPDDLESMRENDNYFINSALFAVIAEVYDPGSHYADDPACWPLRATIDNLARLPPHVVSVNELDPLRDEGLAMYRKLRQSGVPAVGRVVAGTCHGGDLLLPAAIPDVHAASVRDLSGFAAAVAPDA
jgi:acetyl esterase/lipase